MAWGQEVPPVAVDPAGQQAIEAAAGGRAGGGRRLPSGAGHDAQILAPHVPTGMIFVPSIGGVSHAPASAPTPTTSLGAQLLLDTFLALGR